MPRRSLAAIALFASMRILFVALLLGCLGAAAQSPNPAWTNGTVDLNHGWRVQNGDNLAWAQPNFDDSSWPAITLSAANDDAGWRWYRLRTALPAGEGSLALLVIGGNGTFEVYLNGQEVPGPQLLPDLLLTHPRSRMVPLPVASGRAVIALRTHIPATSMFLADRGSFRVVLGTLPAIRDAHQADFGARFESLAPGMAIYVLVLFAGPPLLILFLYQRDHREYLWLGLYLLTDPIGALCFNLATAGLIPFSLNWFFGDPSNYFCAALQIQFTFCFVGQRVTRGWRLYQVLLIAYPLCLSFPSWLGYPSRGTFNIGEIALLGVVAVVLPFLLFFWYRRGNREAGWLILPSLLPLFTISLIDVGIVGDSFHLPLLSRLGRGIPIGPFSIQLFELADLLFLLAIGIVMFFRFTRVSRDQARSAAHLQAARDLQQRLVPASLPSVPGYALHAVYLPAEEVGGDFYQVFPQADGAALAVIGDVSGKGLRAAMTGTLVLGALRSLAQEDLSPSQILSRLNTQLAASSDGGFVTCLVARIAAHGTVMVANAGHLPPYRNGDEYKCNSGLPLGLTADASWCESTLTLVPGDIVTFLSDGVVEAQDAAGQLFGFERAAAISTQSAEAIARAASAHGQSDDITVLTLQYAPAEVIHA